MVAIKTNSFLKKALDTISNPILILGEGGIIIFANRQFAYLLKKEADSCIGVKFTSAFLESADKKQFEQILISLRAKALIENNSEIFISSIIKIDGSCIKCRLTISIIPHDDGIYYSVEIDVIEPKQEDNFADLEFYKGIIDKLPIDVAICDPERRYLYVNPSAIKNSELRASILGKTDFEYFSALGRELTIPRIRKEKFELAKKVKRLVAYTGPRNCH